LKLLKDQVRIKFGGKNDAPLPPLEKGLKKEGTGSEVPLLKLGITNIFASPNPNFVVGVL